MQVVQEKLRPDRALWMLPVT